MAIRPTKQCCAPNAMALKMSEPLLMPPSTAIWMRPLATGAERVQGGGAVVELAAAVVGDDDAVDGVLDRELDVGRVKDCVVRTTGALELSCCGRRS